MNKEMVFGNGIIARRPKDAITHKMPRMPIMIDNIKAEKEEIREFTGQPLHTVLDRDALDGKILHIFTDELKADEYYRQLAPKIPKSSVPPNGGYFEFYDLEDFGGCYWRFLEWETKEIPDFRNIWSCGFLWWGWINANDRVSSIDLATSAAGARLYEHINFNEDSDGSTITMKPGEGWLTNLSKVGWDNRGSSFKLLY